jgi:hypothetical protein
MTISAMLLAIMSENSEKLNRMTEVVRDFIPDWEQKLAYCKSNPANPLKQPATYSILAAYMHRLEIILSLVRNLPDSAKEATQHTNILDELVELETWLGTRKRRSEKETASFEMEYGNYLVSKGFHYSETFQMLQIAKKTKRGAPPTLRPETLRAYDLRLYKQLPYSKIVGKVCACGKLRHNKHCIDSLRHRFRELEGVLRRYGVNVLDVGDNSI